MDVTVCVATYGETSWAELARERAIPSVEQLDVPWIHTHLTSLHEARNEALRLTITPFVAFVDADDELEHGYFEAIERSAADLRVPAVRYVRGRHVRSPIMPKVAGHDHACTAECLADGNWMVIGTVAPTRLLKDVGGFRDFVMYEDYDLWLRCWQAGATIEAVPEAVYRAHVRRTSRNRGPSQDQKFDAHCAISRANGVPEPVRA